MNSSHYTSPMTSSYYILLLHLPYLRSEGYSSQPRCYLRYNFDCTKSSSRLSGSKDDPSRDAWRVLQGIVLDAFGEKESWSGAGGEEPQNCGTGRGTGRPTRDCLGGRGTQGALVRKHLGEFSVFCKVRSELLRPILGLLDPVKHLRICF